MIVCLLVQVLFTVKKEFYAVLQLNVKPVCGNIYSFNHNMQSVAVTS